MDIFVLHVQNTEETLSNQAGVITWPGDGSEALSSATPVLANGYTKGIAVVTEMKGVHGPQNMSSHSPVLI